MKRLIYLLLCTAFLLVSSREASAFDRASDSLQLRALYNSTAGAQWSITWDLQQPMNTWHGVTLDAGGEVMALSLPNNNLRGKLPALNLPKCTLLSLGRNALRDTLPSLNGLPAARIIDLSRNEMDGNIRDFVLPNVQTLNLSFNKITGLLPDFAFMPKLEVLILENNRLSGGLPDFSKMPQLRILRVADNLLDGPIPEFNFIPNLLTLDLHNNRFTGLIPGFRGTLQLFVMDLANNDLTGFIPAFNRHSLLETLRLNGNRLTGTVTTVGNITVLAELNISDNLLEGLLPELKTYRKLTDFNASHNNFSGRIPLYKELENLQRLNLGNNRLGDTLPDLSHLANLTELRVDSNNLKHTNLIATNAPSLQILEVQGNNFTFSDLFQLNATGLTTFIYNNQKPIPMPDTIFATIREDVVFDLVEDFGVGNNTYSWHRDDVFIIGTEVNELVLLDINKLDQGEYYCEIRNSNLPFLILRSELFYLKMDCPFNVVNITDTICQGDTLIVNKKPYFASGEYRDTLGVPDPGTCDSIFVISLTVNPVFSTSMQVTICESESVLFGGQFLNRTGTYIDTLSTIHGCDSIVQLDLLVNPVYTRVANVTLCSGDTLEVGPFDHTTTGIYYDTLQTVFGCDSVIITDLVVLDTFLSVTEIHLCFGETYEFRGVTYDKSGTYIDDLTNTIGCDSIYILHLFIPESTLYPVSRTICAGDSVVVGENTYNNNGIYLDSLVTSGGCDSIVQLTLSVTTRYEQDFDYTICSGDTLFIAGDTLTRPGIYIDTLQAQGGCDSIIKVRLNVSSFFLPRNIDTTLCFGDSLVVGENIYKVDGRFRDTIPGTLCDTIVVSVIEIAPVIELRTVRTLFFPEGVGTIMPFFAGGAGALSYSWNTGSNQRVLDSVPAGLYQLTVTDSRQCSATFEMELDPLTGVNDHSHIFSFEVYPNPVSSSAEWQLKTLGLPPDFYFVEVFDFQGKKIRQETLNLSPGLEILTFDSPPWTGVYTVRLMNKEGSYGIRRLVVR